MPNIVKTKFAGLLRGLLRRMDDDIAMPEPPRPLSHNSSAPPPARADGEGPGAVAENQRGTVAAAAAGADELELPLQPILAGLPMDLRAKIVQNPPAGTTLIMPVEKILSQLAHGSVKISFGELRVAAEGVFVNSGGENDSRPVTVPLNDILSRLNPSLLRRTTQKRIEVAEEIAGPFGANAEGVSFTTQPLKAAAAPAPAAPAPAPAAAEKPIPFAPPTTPSPKPVFAPPSPSKPGLVPPSRSVTPPPAAPIPFPSRGSIAPSHPNGNGNGHGIPDIFGSGKGFDTVSHPPAAPSPAVPAAPAPELSQAAITARLEDLMEQWPEGLRKEILQREMQDTQALLPVSLIEPGLKRGRVSISWKNLRALLRPAPAGVSVHDGLELELPLKVLAPLFFARQKLAKPQQKVAVAEEIPNLFFGFPQPSAAAPAPATPPIAPLPSAPLPPNRPPLTSPPKPATDIFFRKSVETSAPAAAPVPAPAPTPVVPTAPESEVFVEEFKRPQVPATDFSSRYATPEQIVERAMEISGVAGAVVALPDGLKVASEVRANVNPDTIAAFLPQIISRVNQCTRELRMGDLNHLTFTVGMVQWEIFRVGGVFLAAFSDMNEVLPAAQLAKLASQLERRK